MDFFRRFSFLVCAPAFDAEDLEGVRVGEIITAVERLGFQVIRARRVEDAEIAVQTDAAIGCILVDWGKKGASSTATTTRRRITARCSSAPAFRCSWKRTETRTG
jgi:ornithine decarboxylase